MGRWYVYLPKMHKPLIFMGNFMYVNNGKYTIIVPWMQLLMVQKSQTTTWHVWIKPCKNTGIFLPVLNRWAPDFWTINSTPLKINMERYHGGLEDHFPLKMGGFVGSMLIFQGVWATKPTGLPKGPTNSLDWTLQGTEAASDFEKRRPVGVICTADSCGKVGLNLVKMEEKWGKMPFLKLYKHVWTCTKLH